MTVTPATTSSGFGCGSGCRLFLPSTYPSPAQNRTYNYKPINNNNNNNNIHVYGSITFSQTPKPKLGSHCRRRRLLAVSQFVEDSSQSKEPNTKDANIDIKLPRRSLLVQFTCDLCGERTERLINRLAYERGLVYIQCAGCLRHHKLVDNLGLMVEYDLREEINPDSNTDQV